MENLEIYDKFKTVPESAKKPISGGRLNGFTDINAMWRIRCLTEQFGPCGIGWYIKVINKWTEPHGEETAAFVDIELYVRTEDGSWSAPIIGTGGSMMVAIQKGRPYLDDECYKKATTDALSVACRSLGIGADVYWNEDRTKYTNTEEKPAKELVTMPMITSLKQEAKRTGVTDSKVFKWLGVKQYKDITVEKYRYAMDEFKKRPDANERELDMDNIQEELQSLQEELPFR